MRNKIYNFFLQSHVLSPLCYGFMWVSVLEHHFVLSVLQMVCQAVFILMSLSLIGSCVISKGYILYDFKELTHDVCENFCAVVVS